MADNPASPLLGPADAVHGDRPVSKRSTRSMVSTSSTETTPLLSREDSRRDSHDGDPSSLGSSSLRSHQHPSSVKSRKTRRWPSIVALATLTVVVALIIIAGFFAPAAVEEYTKQAIVFQPTNLSIDSFTSTGVRARVKGTFMLDATRVHNKGARTFGRLGTWIAKEVESEESRLSVSLPEYGNVALGTATVPRIVVNIRNGHLNVIDFVTDLEPGEVEGIRRIANDWLDGRLGQLRIVGKANLRLKSGLIPLGVQTVSESLNFQGQSLYSSFSQIFETIFKKTMLTSSFGIGHDLPGIPDNNITGIHIHDVQLPNGQKAMAADTTLTLKNPYPINLTVPPLGFDILVPNCSPDRPYILLANATTTSIVVEPHADVHVNASGVVRQLPDILTAVCPDSQLSPLDLFLGNYIHGQPTMIFVRGSDSPSKHTPNWISDITSSITVPIPVPGRTFDKLIKKFALADVHFGMPDPTAEPGTPESHPKISATVRALVALPRDMRLPINVSRVRADADIYYHGEKLGYLDLHKWQPATTTINHTENGDPATLLVESSIKDAPLQITNDDIFTDVVQALIFGGKGVMLGIKTNVTVEVATSLGAFVIKRIPAEGKVAVKPLHGKLSSLAPKIRDLEILETSKATLLLRANMNFTNPTNYSASVPFVSINILNNGTVLGQATAKNINVVPGENGNVPFQALWDPSSASGDAGRAVARELLSQYISGFNTTLTFQTHEGTIPSQPALGRALSFLKIELPTPRLHPPKSPNGGDDDGGDGKDGRPRFIDDATMHLLTSTATFTLLSPLQRTTLYLTHINATAFYNHTQPVGKILYELPFAVPPEPTQTPNLPVDWSLGGVGYDAVKSALGGSLKLDAKAIVGIKIGEFVESVWFEGRGIGAKVRI